MSDRLRTGGEGYLSMEAIAPRLSGPRGADRAFIAGRSGSGKTFLAQHLLRHYHPKAAERFRGNVCIIDPNHNFEIEADALHESPAGFGIDRRDAVTIYRPGPEHRTGDAWNSIWKALFWSDAPRIMTYVDEAYAMETMFSSRRFADGDPNYLTAYLTQGRAKGRAAILAAQRPVAIPRNIIAQAEFFFAFDLPVEDDRAVIAGTIGRTSIDGEDIRQRTSLKRYEFWCLTPDLHSPARLKVV